MSAATLVCAFGEGARKIVSAATFFSRTAALKKQAQGSTSLRHSLSKKSLRAFSPSCFQNCKISFCVFILQFCRCGGLLNAKGNPDGFLSHYLSLRNFRLSSFFDSLRRRGARPCAITFLFYCFCSSCRACRRTGRASAGSVTASAACSIGQGPVPARFRISGTSVPYSVRTPASDRRRWASSLMTSPYTAFTPAASSSSAAARPIALFANFIFLAVIFAH